MKIGGGGREVWMVLLPMGALAGILTVLAGGPHETLIQAEQLFYEVWSVVSVWFRG